MKKTKKNEFHDLLFNLHELSVWELFHVYIEAKTGRYDSIEMLSEDISKTIDLLAIELDKLYHDRLDGPPFVNPNY